MSAYLANQLVQELLSFDDGHKKKIIEESVRTSSGDFHSEGSSLWLGHFVLPRSRQSDSGGGAASVAIFHSNAIIRSDPALESAFYRALLEGNSCPQKHYCENHYHEEYIFKKCFDEEKDQLIRGGGRETQAQLASYAPHA